jgi:hypothetical protein
MRKKNEFIGASYSAAASSFYKEKEKVDKKKRPRYTHQKKIGMVIFNVGELSPSVFERRISDKNKCFRQVLCLTEKNTGVSVAIIGKFNQLINIPKHKIIFARMNITRETRQEGQKKIYCDNIDLYLDFHSPREPIGELKICQRLPEDKASYKKVWSCIQGGTVIIKVKFSK